MTLPDGRDDLIQLRRDTAADWAAVDPVLEFGEPGWDATNQVLKIGDGVTAWSALPVAFAGTFADSTLFGIHTTGRYFTAIGTPTAAALTINVETATPFVVPAGKTYDRINCEITAAAPGGLVRLGIRADDGTGYPGAPIIDAGTVDASTIGAKSIVIAQALSRGVVWLCGACQGAAVSAQVVAGVNPYIGPSGGGLGLNTNGNTAAIVQTGVPGALPAGFIPAAVGIGIRVSLRAA